MTRFAENVAGVLILVAAGVVLAGWLVLAVRLYGRVSGSWLSRNRRGR